MSNITSGRGNEIIWVNVITVLSAAILIGAEVFGAAFAAGWAFAHLSGFSDYVYVFQGVFFALGVFVMISFIRNAKRVEPFMTSR
jgi:membrane protein implicated in regulation of membrane protease activity